MSNTFFFLCLLCLFLDFARLKLSVYACFFLCVYVFLTVLLYSDGTEFELRVDDAVVDFLPHLDIIV